MVSLRRRCKCGCGSITNPGRKWLKGHYARVNNPTVMKGMTGKNHPTYKHGLKHHKLYGVWQCMKQRCCNPNQTQYQHYGGRGIRVYIRWRLNFKSFYDWAIENGWQEGLEIDRRDNNGNYHPDNCRLITHKKNCFNKGDYKIAKNNTTGHKGVSFCNTRKKYLSYPAINGKQKYLGAFNTIKEAAQAIEEYKCEN